EAITFFSPDRSWFLVRKDRPLSLRPLEQVGGGPYCKGPSSWHTPSRRPSWTPLDHNPSRLWCSWDDRHQFPPLLTQRVQAIREVVHRPFGGEFLDVGGLESFILPLHFQFLLLVGPSRGSGLFRRRGCDDSRPRNENDPR